jgi:hypothetical protein
MPFDHPHFNQALPRVCVIGAGSTGIAVIKALKDAHIPFVCFERSDRVGGNWVFRNANGMSAAYRSLHINTSRARMQFRSYPMPEDYPDFAHHTLLARYFQNFVDHFGLAPFIDFGRTVKHVQPRADGTYAVLTDDDNQTVFDAVIVANGHHWDPRYPTPRLPGSFGGIELHAHDYVDPHEPHELVGKRVIVVGMGNSAMDIASELGHRGVAERVFLSARRGAWIVPKYFFGKPIDQPRAWFPARILGERLQTALLKAMVTMEVGRMEDYGLPAPDHEPGQAHPTISSEILLRIGSGDVIPKPQIANLEGDYVRFVDDSRERVDAIIYCTGYNVSFPFFDPSFIVAPDNDLPLFRRALKPGLPNLFFAGLCQPLGAIMPIAEVQGEWFADILCGAYALPSVHEMERDIALERAALHARYVPSARHTMQIDFDAYLRDLQLERSRGRVRARRNGYRPVLQPRARYG